MRNNRNQLEAVEKKHLAPYAILSGKSRGREYKELEDDLRTCFARDRDRIIHSKAFRRLAGKTQVFAATFGDHYRERLSHTLEMAQIARGICITLGLNEDLAEAIALAHDLGHPPFGHAGEETLDKIMRKFGFHFEHNEQSKRIVEKLEDRYPDFRGLNLTWEVRDGLTKHQTHFDQRGKKISGKSLESQVVDLADEIAYHNHDLDDGLRSKIFKIENLRRLSLWRTAENQVFKKYGKNIGMKYLRHRAISALIGMMILDVCIEADKRLKKWKIKRPEDAIKKPKNVISFSVGFEKEVLKLRRFLWNNMYRSAKVLKHSKAGQRVLEGLFWKFYKNPELLPAKLKAKIDTEEPKEVIIKDYVAGMTDSYALNLYKKLL